ncbi:MAG: sigma-70 family RNA polymerase sigma factor [Chloroflexi bacterium]|nr:sigma-70 family RNA polymerase sigma factor [Chloroflexota bacterium]
MAPTVGSDEYWVEKARREPDAFSEVVTRYQDRIFNYTYRMTGSREDAQDLAQETFLRVYLHLDTFRVEERFSPWIYRIATNLSLNHLKRRKRNLPLLPEALDLEQPGSPDSALEAREERLALQAAILTLPEHYRAVIVLRHVEELSYDEIAQVLDLPLGTVKTRLFRARELLQKELKDLRRGANNELRTHPRTAPSVS